MQLMNTSYAAICSLQEENDEARKECFAKEEELNSEKRASKVILAAGRPVERVLTTCIVGTCKKG